MARILFFAPAFAPNLFSEGLVNSKLALSMLLAGWEVEVVAVDASGSSYSSTWDAVWMPLKEVRHDVDSSLNGPKLLSTLNRMWRLRHPIQGMHWAANAVDRAIELHDEKPFDMVLSRSTSCMAHLPALAFKKLTGCRWVANWNDPAPYLFPRPYDYRMVWWKKLLFSRYMKDCAGTADFNSFPSARLRDYLSPYLGLKDKKEMLVIPHIAMPNFQPTEYEKGKGFSMCHAGNLSSERNPELFLKALKRLQEQYPETPMSFEIIGVEGVDVSQIVADLKLDGAVSFVSSLPFQQTLEKLCTYDVNVIIEADCSDGIFMPSKLTDYAQANRPMLAVSPERGVVQDWLKEYGGGLAASNVNEADIYEKLEELFLAWKNDALCVYQPTKIAAVTMPESILKEYKALFV